MAVSAEDVVEVCLQGGVVLCPLGWWRCFHWEWWRCVHWEIGRGVSTGRVVEVCPLVAGWRWCVHWEECGGDVSTRYCQPLAQYYAYVVVGRGLGYYSAMA